MLTVRDIEIILEALRKQYGHGYSDVKDVGALQAKLSIMLELAASTGR